MRTLKWVALAWSALVLGSCCHEAGCRSAVSFELGAGGDQFAPDQPVDVHACLDAQCVTETLTLRSGSDLASSDSDTLMFNLATRTLQFKPTTGTGEGSHTVSLELSRQGSVVLSATRESVPFKSFAPNGPSCTPICWSASVAL